MRAPVSPQEWYEAGVLFRREERFGEAINAFARAAALASEEMEAAGVPHEGVSSENGSSHGDDSQMDKIPELSRIRAAALASIDLIREITSFANTDLMNP